MARRKSSKRGVAPQAKHSVRGASVLGKPRKKKRGAKDEESLEELLGVDPFHRNEITLSEINKLRNMMDTQGIRVTSRDLNLDRTSLLMITSGFGHRLIPRTAERIREYLRK